MANTENNLYDVYFSGKYTLNDLGSAQQNFATIFKSDIPKIAYYFDGQDYLLKSNLNQQEAEQYSAYFAKQGLSLTICPQGQKPEKNTGPKLSKEAEQLTLLQAENYDDIDPITASSQKSSASSSTLEWQGESSIEGLSLDRPNPSAPKALDPKANYDLIFSGQYDHAKITEEVARESFCQLLKCSKDQASYYFKGKDRIIKEKTSYSEAMAYSELFSKYGLTLSYRVHEVKDLNLFDEGEKIEFDDELEIIAIDENDTEIDFEDINFFSREGRLCKLSYATIMCIPLLIFVAASFLSPMLASILRLLGLAFAGQAYIRRRNDTELPKWMPYALIIVSIFIIFSASTLPPELQIIPILLMLPLAFAPGVAEENEHGDPLTLAEKYKPALFVFILLVVVASASTLNKARDIRAQAQQQTLTSQAINSNYTPFMLV